MFGVTDHQVPSLKAEAGWRARCSNTRLTAGLDLLLAHGLRAVDDSGLDARRAASVLPTGTGLYPAANKCYDDSSASAP